MGEARTGKVRGGGEGGAWLLEAGEGWVNKVDPLGAGPCKGTEDEARGVVGPVCI